MEIDYKVIGKRIREIRRQKGWSQEKLSEKIGVTTIYISRIERGHTKINLKRLSQMSQVLNVRMEQLIMGNSNANYVDRELYEMLIKCTPEKQRLIYTIVKILEEAKLG